MPRKGRDLEKLVKVLEQSEFGGEGTRISSPGFLEDIRTNTPREFDVLVDTQLGHHKVTLAFECRDRNRPVGVPDIEAFQTKCTDCRIDKKIIVSTSGFAETAKQKADAYGIRLLSIEQCSSLQSILLEHFHLFETKLLSSHWKFNVKDGATLNKSNIRIEDAEGNELTRQMLDANFTQMRSKHPEWPSDGKVRIHFPSSNLVVVDKSSGTRLPVVDIDLTVQLETIATKVPAHLSTYKDESGRLVKEIASADVELGPVKGKLVVANSLEAGGGIFFVPAVADERPPKKIAGKVRQYRRKNSKK